MRHEMFYKLYNNILNMTNDKFFLRLTTISGLNLEFLLVNNSQNNIVIHFMFFQEL